MCHKKRNYVDKRVKICEENLVDMETNEIESHDNYELSNENPVSILFLLINVMTIVLPDYLEWWSLAFA